MKAYPKLLLNQLWTITDHENGDENIMIIEDYCLKKTEYPQEIYENIIRQSEDYRIISKSCLEREERMKIHVEEGSSSEKINAECIVVRDGAFAGIYTLCIHESETHLHSDGGKYFKGILFTDGTAVGTNYDQFDRRPGYFHYTESYFLEKADN